LLKEQELQKQKQDEQSKLQQPKSSAQNTSAKSSPQSTTVLNTPPSTELFNAPQAPTQPSAKETSPTQTPTLTDEQKRLQAIQEMKEQEKRKREEIAGKIDMNEQHALMYQFEQNIFKY
jgi:hypothetical protein